MVTTRPDGSRGIVFVGREHHDRLVRSPSGWRVTEPIEQSLWTDGELPAAPPG